MGASGWMLRRRFLSILLILLMSKFCLCSPAMILVRPVVLTMVEGSVRVMCLVLILLPRMYSRVEELSIITSSMSGSVFVACN